VSPAMLPGRPARERGAPSLISSSKIAPGMNA